MSHLAVLMKLNKKSKKLKNENIVSVKSFCEGIKGKSICNCLVKAPQDSRLDPKTCRLQTFDVAGNKSGKTKGAVILVLLKNRKRNSCVFSLSVSRAEFVLFQSV